MEVACRIKLRNVTQCYAKHAYKHYFFVRAQKKQPLAAVCVLVDEVVRRMRLELTRPFGHYPLKVACIPISPPAHWLYAASKHAMEKLLPHDAALSYVKCPKQDSNLHVIKHSHLKRARLPIPPFGHR